MLSYLVTEFYKDILVTLLVGGFGFLSKATLDKVKTSLKLRHMFNVFGVFDFRKNPVRFVLPIFEPMSYDNFSKTENSTLVKKIYNKSTYPELETIKVPLYSQIIIIDDFRAYRKLDRLFAQYNFGFLEFRSDTDSLPNWKEDLIVCFGGPRSNQKLSQILKDDSFNFFQIDDSSDLLEDWKLSYQTPSESFEHKSTKPKAISYILKYDNPRNKIGKIMAIAGDSALSTNYAAKYLCENLKSISKQFKKSNFLIVLSSDRTSYESISPIKEVNLS